MSENYEDCLQHHSIKQEPLDSCIKEEPSDDEFVETPIKIQIKEDPNVFSYDSLEPNNNYTIKTELILNTIDELDHKDEDQRLKLEIEEEGIQYDCKEFIKVDCPFCNKSFGTTRHLMKHMKKRFSCKYRANSPKKILKQISKPFKCQVCLKYFSSVQKKDQHIKNHFRRSYVICQICGKPTIKHSEYLKHFIIHVTKQIPIKCKFCPKKFATKLVYFKHLLTHKKATKRSKCKTCFCTLTKKSMKAHNKQTKLSCEYCTKPFCIKSQLTVHLRSHTGEKPFQCTECLHSFSTSGNLIKHSRIHTGDKPFSCKTCLKRFSRSDYLNKHYRTIHKSIYGNNNGKRTRPTAAQVFDKKNEEEVVCGICSNKYPSKQSLISHMRVHNKEKKFRCDICSKTFLYKGLLNGHLKTHLDNKPFACSLCPKKFIRSNDLTRHTYIHTKEKNYKCEICLDRFARKDVLRLHLRAHTGQRPYKCENCLKTFVQKGNLTHHLKKCNTFYEVIVD